MPRRSMGEWKYSSTHS